MLSYPGHLTPRHLRFRVMKVFFEKRFMFNHRPGHTVGYGPGETEVPVDVAETAIEAGKAVEVKAEKPKKKTKAKKSAPENKSA